MPYYNTTNLRGRELSEAEKKTVTQDELVLAFFQRHPGGTFTGWDVLKNVFGGTPVPFTSVCRALDTLHKNGKILKTGETVRSGPYNKKCHQWRLKPTTPSQIGLWN